VVNSSGGRPAATDVAGRHDNRRQIAGSVVSGTAPTEAGHASSPAPSLPIEVLRRFAGAAVAAVAVALLCHPLLRAPFVADDVTVLSRSIARSQTGSGIDLILYRIEENLNALHWLPLAGAAEGLQAWSSIAIARATALDVQQVWAAWRVIWILLVILAATWLVVAWRPVWPGRTPKSAVPVFALLGLLAATSVQVHALWSNDPVISYTAYAWPSVVLSLVYLGLVGRMLTSSVLRVWTAFWAVAVGSAAVLAYELSLGALLGAGLAAMIAIVLGWRPARATLLSWASLAAVVLMPALVLVASLLLRDPSDGSYAGTQFRPGALAVQTWVVGLVGAVPGASWLRGYTALGAPLLSLRSVAAVIVAIAALIVVARSSPSSVGVSQPAVTASWTTRPLAAAAPLLALVTYWSVATAIHAVTPKYQDEIGLTVGGVYLFYAVGFACFMLLAHALLSALRPRVGATLSLIGCVGLSSFALYQTAYNAQLTSILAAQGWSRDVLVAAAERTPRPQRCEAFDELASVPLEPVLEDRRALVFASTTGYEQRHGEPFCGSSVRAEMKLGAYPGETDAEGRRFWWVRDDRAILEVVRPADAVGPGRIILPIGNVPCRTTRVVTISADSEERVLQLDETVTSGVVEFLVRPGVERLPISFATSGLACHIPGDPRNFLLYIGTPNFLPAD
jgi:hypothetical protein